MLHSSQAIIDLTVELNDLVCSLLADAISVGTFGVRAAEVWGLVKARSYSIKTRQTGSGGVIELN